MTSLTLIQAAEEVLKEDPKTMRQENVWLYFVKVLRKLGFPVRITFTRQMPTPESILKTKRDILNNPDNKEKYAYLREEFIPEENTSYEEPNHA